MNEIGNIIKKIAKATIEQDKPVSVVIGKVNESFEVETEQKLVIPKNMLIVPKRINYDSLEANDNLILLRCDGGQRYLIIDTL